MSGKTFVVDQGIRWSSRGNPYDTWTPEQLQKAKTYWKHQYAIIEISGHIPEFSQTLEMFALGRFENGPDVARRIGPQARDSLPPSLDDNGGRRNTPPTGRGNGGGGNGEFSLEINSRR